MENSKGYRVKTQQIHQLISVFPETPSNFHEKRVIFLLLIIVQSDLIFLSIYLFIYFSPHKSPFSVSETHSIRSSSMCTTVRIQWPNIKNLASFTLKFMVHLNLAILSCPVCPPILMNVLNIFLVLKFFMLCYLYSNR